jgi:hypothetical protein
MKVDTKLAELAPLNTNVRKSKLRWHLSQQTHQIHSIRPKTHILVCSGPFRYSTKVDAKLAELAPLAPKFAKRSCVEIFRTERTQSTPLDQKLMFWGVSDHFVTVRTLMQSWLNTHL